MHYSMSNGIETSKDVLKRTGHWPEASTTWSKICELMSFSIATFLAITLAMELVKHLQDYEILTEHLAITIAPTSFLFKLIIFKSHCRQFTTLLQRLNLEVFNNHPRHLNIIMKNSIKMSALIGLIYRCICYTVVILYCLIPFLGKMDLPMRFSYDLGSFKSLMYIFQVVGLANAVLVNASLDVLVMSLMGMAAAQIDILNQRISGFKSSKGGKETEIYMSTLQECVVHHNEIIRYVENIEDVFSLMFLVQYLSSAVGICNIGFQLVHVKPGSIQFANMVFYFLAMMCQLGMYCWYGNEIILKSVATKDACYDSDWIDCEIKIRKMLITISERSKRPLYLTAGKFSTLSLGSFATVINTSYSYFALMQRLYRNTQN